MSDNFKVTVSKRIKYLLDRNQETQQDMANRIGLSRSVVSQWVTGDRTPALPALTALAQAYDVTTDWIIGLAPLDTMGGEAAVPVMADAKIEKPAAEGVEKFSPEVLQVARFLTQLQNDCNESAAFRNDYGPIINTMSWEFEKLTETIEALTERVKALENDKQR